MNEKATPGETFAARIKSTFRLAARAAAGLLIWWRHHDNIELQGTIGQMEFAILIYAGEKSPGDAYEPE